MDDLGKLGSWDVAGIFRIEPKLKPVGQSIGRHLAWGVANENIIPPQMQGLPIRLRLTAGQSHDGQAADDLLDHVGSGTIVLADKAYDADRIRASLRERGAFANIPPKANRRSKPYFNTWLYRERT